MNENHDGISRKVLFVDDEPLLLQGIKRQLRRDYDVTIAEGGEAALSLLETQGPFAVVVSDYNMPGMDGIVFLNTVFQRYPDTVLVMLTGRAELDVAVSALHNAHISRFLGKPCPREILQETLNDGLEQYRLRKSEQLLKARLQEANLALEKMNEQLEVLVDKKTRALALQYRHAALMAQMSDSAEVCETFIQAVKQLTGLDGVRLWLSRNQDETFICAESGASRVFRNSERSGVVGKRCFGEKKYWTRHDAAGKLDETDEAEWFPGQPLLAIPLITRNSILGLLVLAGNGEPVENEMIEALTGMADTSASALMQHWQSEAFVEAQDALITALAKLSEYRDPETGAHLLRLKKYCALIGGHLSQTDRYRDIVTPEFIADLVRSSPLHDIGKVGIPDAILKKPGRLTPEEFEIMKGHAAIGGDTLRAVFDNYPSQTFIKCGMEVAYGHHEKWDGSGYPLGLKGEAIPLSARILALVDVYDALTCRRVYKAPFPRDKAEALILEGSGVHFDPELVAAFVELEPEFNGIAERYADIF